MTELVKRQVQPEIIEQIVQQHQSLLPQELKEPYEPATQAWLFRALSAVPLVRHIVPLASEKHELIHRLLHEQKTATTYKDWYRVSAQLDELTGSNAWKLNPESVEYDFRIVSQQLQEMRAARQAKDYKLLMYFVRTKWSRNIGNMGNLNLYRHSHVGTKRLIEEYIDECQKTLRYLVHDPTVELADRYLLGMLIQTRKNIGRTALVLSGGLTFGVSHIGVLVALLENNLLPRVISGLSAGSIIASILCTHTNEETHELLKSMLTRDFNFFGPQLTEDAEGKLRALLLRLSHLLKYGTVFGIGGIRDTVYGFVGDLTFREAYNRTGKILNITVSPASTHEQTRLLNYLTGPHCLIWSAVCALCSVPGIFASNSIYEKDARTGTVRVWNNDQALKFVDGSVDGDLPITRLSEMFNVDHIIAVQVNPHVLPVLKVSVGNVGGRMDSDLVQTLRNALNNCYDFVTSEIIHYLQVCHELNIQKNFTLKMISIMTQRYLGDITILPDLASGDFLSLFSNPTPEFMMDFILKGARAAWPKLSIINNHCGMEFALDKEIGVLRGRIVSNAAKMIAPETEKTASMSATNSNSYLINAPLLNTDEYNQTDPGNERKDEPTRAVVRRHNSIGTSVMKKRTVSSPSSLDLAGSSKLRVISNSLVLLHSSAFAAAHNSSERLFQFQNEEKAVNIHGSYQGERDAGSCGINFNSLRKARSSGSFVDRSEPINPNNLKPEISLSAVIDYDDFAARAFGTDSISVLPQAQRVLCERPNLPRLLKPNSVNGSFVGLDRLNGTKAGVNSGATCSRVLSQSLKAKFNLKLKGAEARRNKKSSYVELVTSSLLFKNAQSGKLALLSGDRSWLDPVETPSSKANGSKPAGASASPGEDSSTSGIVLTEQTMSPVKREVATKIEKEDEEDKISEPSVTSDE